MCGVKVNNCEIECSWHTTFDSMKILHYAYCIYTYIRMYNSPFTNHIIQESTVQCVRMYIALGLILYDFTTYKFLKQFSNSPNIQIGFFNQIERRYSFTYLRQIQNSITIQPLMFEISSVNIAHIMEFCSHGNLTH